MRTSPSGSSRPAPPTCWRRTSGIPHDLGDALDIALSGRTRRIDLGVVNGEHFGVMAGAGFDARMIDAADQEAKSRHGSLAYVRTRRVCRAGRTGAGPRARRRGHLLRGAGQLRPRRQCPSGDRRPPRLRARRTRRRAARRRRGHRRRSGAVAAGADPGGAAPRGGVTLHPHAAGSDVDVRFERPTVYELDGGTRAATDQLCFEVKPRAVVHLCAAGASSEHRPAHPRDVGAERRRRLADAGLHRTAEPHARRLPADALVRRIQPLPVARLPDRPGGHPGDHRARRCGQRLRRVRTQRRHRRCRAGRRPRAGGRPAHRGGDAGSGQRRRPQLPSARPRSPGFAAHGHDRHGTARAGPQPPLRRGAGPALRPEVRPRPAAGGEQRSAGRSGLRAARLRALSQRRHRYRVAGPGARASGAGR